MLGHWYIPLFGGPPPPPPDYTLSRREVLRVHSPFATSLTASAAFSPAVTVASAYSPTLAVESQLDLEDPP